jgi:predicted ArsR family transcriptional regulator
MRDRPRNLLDLMRVRGDVTVDELAAELKLTRTTIVNHLNRLMGEGYVRRSGLRRGRRRPSVVYKLTPSADRIFPQLYEEFLNDVLEDLGSRRPPTIKQVICDVRDHWIARDLPVVKGFRGKQRINRALDILSKRGFMPALQRRGRVAVLQQYNCPLVRLCERYPDVPDMILRWIKALFGTPTTRSGCIAMGNASCSYVLGRGARSLKLIPKPRA